MKRGRSGGKGEEDTGERKIIYRFSKKGGLDWGMYGKARPDSQAHVSVPVSPAVGFDGRHDGVEI